MTSGSLRKPGVLGIGAAFACAFAATAIAGSPFRAVQLAVGYGLERVADAKGGEGACGANECINYFVTKQGMSRADASARCDKLQAEGKCGEGVCGGEVCLSYLMNEKGLKKAEAMAQCDQAETKQ